MVINNFKTINLYTDKVEFKFKATLFNVVSNEDKLRTNLNHDE